MLKLIDHNRYLVTAILAAGALAGCALLQPKTLSPVGPERVNRDQLDALWEATLANRKSEDAKFRLAIADLERKQTTINGVTDAVVSLIPAIPGPWAGIAGAAASALALGLGMDNGRKNRVIRQLKGTAIKPKIIEK